MFIIHLFVYYNMNITNYQLLHGFFL